MEILKKPLVVAWAEIEKNLGTLVSVEGGYTKARRGIVQLSDNRRVFVKIGADETTKKWVNREISVYRILQKYDFEQIPELLSVNSDNTGFAIDALEKSSGWEWSNTWDEERLGKTLKAMDDLANVGLTGEDKNILSDEKVIENKNGWEDIAQNKEYQKILISRWGKASLLNFSLISQQNSAFVFDYSKLVHNDVRADNCAWNPKLEQVKLIDWNWTQLGDRRIDVNAVLVDIQLSGFDVLKTQKNRLDKEALIWLAGFWFNSVVVKTAKASSLEKLIDFQLRSSIMAMEMASKIG